ncbi:calcium-binding protein [Phaeobacter inhibens]|uniref:calcium-binding protein n=1 Tax=Phaeobacter inhibens TaxID=221822 RepID=UPI000C9CD2A8|nr:calcium-binding protein [Phaeobacter inhibens]AUQ72880.1 hemolysin-like protein [Phaeobacter inhibens]
MANIEVEGGATFVAGTTGDDAVTLTDSLGFTANLNGNGGADTLTLNNDDLDSLVDGAGEEVSYDAGTDTWTIDDDNSTPATAATLTGGFTSVTFNDGVTLEAGVASSGTIAPGAANSGAAATLTTTKEYDWTGASASTSEFTADSIISVDGQEIATVGSSFTNASGAFVVDSAAEQVTFTANTAAVSAQGNVGETATFTYDVVVADSTTGEQRTVSVTWNETIPFTVGDDTFVGAAGAAHTTQDGLAGNDNITGAELNDSLTGGDGNDMLSGLDGNDTLIGSAGDDTLVGGDGNDVLNESGDTGATAGNNVLSGGAGLDNIDGGEGNDILRGGGDADDIAGGAGNDTIFAGNGDDVAVTGGAGEDLIFGGAGDDSVTGGDDNDELRGGDGDDTLEGDDGNDVLRGGEGADSLDGGNGKDFLYTSKGDGDVLTGGDGNDVFVLKAATGTTTVTDFVVGDDKMDVSELGYTSVADVMANAYELGAGGAGVVIEIDADTSVTLDNVTLASLGELDFVFA